MRQEFWNNLQMIRKHYVQSLERVCHKWGLTRAEMDVLLFLYHNPELDRAADIVELRGLTKSHVSIAVKDLYGKGLLEACQDEEDHRVIHLKPTAAAAQIITDGEAGQRVHYAKLFEGFTQEELEQWKALQEKLLANINAMNGQ